MNNKSANALYKESGSELPFKDWLTEEKAKGTFIYNDKLNKKIMDNIGQHSFHSADGTTPAIAAVVATTTQSGFTKRDAKMIIVGAGSAIVLFFIAKHLIHGTRK